MTQFLVSKKRVNDEALTLTSVSLDVYIRVSTSLREIDADLISNKEVCTRPVKDKLSHEQMCVSADAYLEGRRSADPEDDGFGLSRIAPANLGLATKIKAVAHSKLEFLATQFDVKAAALQIYELLAFP